jgi:hypothetical protein
VHLYLYWLTTPDHHEDCFVVSTSNARARSFFEGYEGYNPGDSTAEPIERLPSDALPDEGYARPQLLSRLGYRTISEDQPLIYAKEGRSFVYGDTNYAVLMDGVARRPGVYCMRCAGSNFIKVGQTRDLHLRVRKLQTGCPYRLIVDFFIPWETPRIVERKLHRDLRKFKTQFEWFDVTNELRAEFYAKARKFAVRKLRTEFHEYIVWSP